MQDNELLQIRTKIDLIDSEISNLLIRRMELVKHVGKIKERNSAKGKSFIRSGREASMLRNLTEKMHEYFPPKAIVNIWRTIIAASLATEQEMKIGAYVKDGDESCFWLGREYFGNILGIKSVTDADKLIKMLEQDELSVIILPLFDDSSAPWWQRPRDEANDLYVFAMIPFIDGNDEYNKKAVAIAKLTPEETGDDVSLVAVTTNSDEDELLKAFSKENIDVEIIESHNDNYFLRVKKYLEKSDAILSKLEASLSENSKVRFMGSYAVPIKLTV